MKSLPTQIYTNTRCNYMSNRIRNCRNRLVIFPMSGNNTFETSDFADLASLFGAARVSRTLPRCFYGKNYCET